MNPSQRKRLTDVTLIVVCLAFVLLSWYAYLGLKRGNLGMVVLANLFFGSGALYGFVSLIAKDFDASTLALKQLSPAKNLLVSIVVLVWATCFFWLATMSQEVATFFREAVGIQLPSFLYGGLLLGGGVFFGWGAIRSLLKGGPSTRR